MIQGEFFLENTLMVDKTLRSGQKVNYPGNIVILGDVNPGAEVVASGSIIVLGTVRGVVHAGAEGFKKAVVLAFRLLPTQLRIADHITRAPDGETVGDSFCPEIALIKDDMVVIESYEGNLSKLLK